jgi:hypothetical protein
MSAISNITNKSISLPIVGAVSVPIVIGIGLLAYFAFFRNKRRITSITTRYGRR